MSRAPSRFPSSITPHLAAAACLAAAGLVGGCGTYDSPRAFEQKSAALHLADDCDDLLERLRQDALARLEITAEDARQGALGLRSLDLTGDFPLLGGGVATQDGGDFGLPGNASPERFSETNAQTEGVAEADIVQTDGERIYLLHGNQFLTFDAWPADQTALLGATTLPGLPHELLVEGGKALVFSQASLDELPQLAHAEVEAEFSAYDCYGCQEPGFTTIRFFDVTGDAPVLERALLVEGRYVSSRRHGDTVRVILRGQRGPTRAALAPPSWSWEYDSSGRRRSRGQIVEAIDAWEASSRALIEESELGDWLPLRFSGQGASDWERLPLDCKGFFVPEPGLTPDGLVQVATFDLEEATSSFVSVVGDAETVYSSEDTLIVGQTDQRWLLHRTDETRTALHAFGLRDDTTTYLASGFVPGYLHDQFSLDERDGVVRVATTLDVVTNGDDWTTETENRVYTLERRGERLEVLGRTKPFGEQGESIFATRFIGERAYVVTFLQTDPLITVDLSDAAEPKVVGQLHIPGFSDYIHPLPGQRLLTVGQAGTEDGAITGVAVKLFDVSGDTATLLHEYVYGQGYTEVSSTHKAFTFVQDEFGPDESLLMFPLSLYDSNRDELTLVRVGGESGVEPLGRVDHGALVETSCSDSSCYYQMRRGLLIGEEDGPSYVYAISDLGLTVHPLAEPRLQSGAISLPRPTYDDYY